jgi:hypothetical protein
MRRRENGARNSYALLRRNRIVALGATWVVGMCCGALVVVRRGDPHDEELQRHGRHRRAPSPIRPAFPRCRSSPFRRRVVATTFWTLREKPGSPYTELLDMLWHELARWEWVRRKPEALATARYMTIARPWCDAPHESSPARAGRGEKQRVRPALDPVPD